MARNERRLIARGLIAAVTTVGLTAAITIAAAAPASATTDSVAVNFGSSTGLVLGAAAGALYGMSDNGVPTAPILDGANPVSLTQKAPNGLQHPNGDPLATSNEFFSSGGKYMFVYLQDAYADWPYNGGVRPSTFSTYLSMITTAVQAVKTNDPSHFSHYVFVPFNEPDGGNWYANYATMGAQFLADWDSAYSTIKAIDSGALVGGPALASYSHQRISDLLTHGKANSDLPNFVIWHELSRSTAGVIS